MSDQEKRPCIAAKQNRSRVLCPTTCLRQIALLDDTPTMLRPLRLWQQGILTNNTAEQYHKIHQNTTNSMEISLAHVCHRYPIYVMQPWYIQQHCSWPSSALCPRALPVSQLTQLPAHRHMTLAGQECQSDGQTEHKNEWWWMHCITTTASYCIHRYLNTFEDTNEPNEVTTRIILKETQVTYYRPTLFISS